MDPLKIPMDDQETMSIFSSTEALEVTPEQINSKVGTFGIPEFTKRKQEFEILMKYYWLYFIEGDDDGYWQEYMEKMLPSINKKQK